MVPWVAVWVALLLWSGPGFAQDPAGSAEAYSGRLFLEAVGAYQGGDYAAAVSQFEALVASGVVNGKLYYNLGNAWLKAGDLGRAVLWYERAALLLGPADPELRFNREYAQGLTVDEPPETGVEWDRVLLFWRGRVPRWVLVGGVVGLNAAFWLLLAARRVWRRRSLRRWAALCGAGLALLLLTLGADAWSARRAPGGVILPPEVPVRSATSPEATELFRLHAGSLVRVDRHQDDYVRIRYGSQTIGWVPAGAVGLIREPLDAPGTSRSAR
ncbi:MAG TPA: tetratricopeptide repeat protein [Deferrisomatales bacterium]|nr:tetratricopeptide repeat protein [Deferrisomatales bacterium]